VIRSAILAVFAAMLLCAACSEAIEEPSKNARRVALQYPEPELTEFHKQVLTSMKLPFTVEIRADGEAVWWTPSDKAQEMEVQMRVSQYAFVLKACGPPQLVTPETPAGTITSC